MFYFDHKTRYEESASEFHELVATGYESVARYYEINAAERVQMDVPPVWKRPLDSRVLRLLQALSYGRCPFCERANVALQPYRFRPPAYAEPISKPEEKASYLWLAFHWDNFFPICDDCVPRRKNFFPVSADRAPNPASTSTSDDLKSLATLERPLLLYPGELENPQTAFTAQLDGTLVGRTKRAAATIKHFGLNRTELVAERSAATERLLVELETRPKVDDAPATPFTHREFGGFLYLVLRRVAWEFGRQARSTLPVGQATIQASFHRWMERSDYHTTLHEALRALREAGLAAGSRSPGTAAWEPPEIGGRLEGVTITNFKSLANISIKLPPAPDVSNDPLLTLTGDEDDARRLSQGFLILGENAAGKSSLLEAIALAAMPSDQANNVIVRSDRELIPLDPRYMESLAPQPQGPQRRSAEVHLVFEGGQQRSISIDPQRGEIELQADNVFQPVVFAYGARRLFGSPRRRGAIRHVDTLFKRDAQISNPEPWLIDLWKRDRDALSEVVSALRHIIQIEGRFEDIDVEVDASGLEHCMIKLKKQRSNGEEFIMLQRLDAASSGYRAILALVCDVLQGLMKSERSSSRPGKRRASRLDHARAARRLSAIVLVDEIEAHLHPRWKLSIMTGLRRALPNANFIVTSHDPLCLRGMRNGEVGMLNRYLLPDREAEAVQLVANFTNFENLTIEQLLTSNLFQLFSTDHQRTDSALAKAASILSRNPPSSNPLSGPAEAAIDAFNDEIASALPYGRSEVTQLVQEAVAEYLAERRTEGSDRSEDLRRRAKKQVLDYLRGGVG
ncbi:AAA family ATPase [Mesorhizobium sp. NZP2077]|uniref:AAA family ATPase n=1 Tax=Mesorhizobium sp. NZP2077 TaxID=2483404 RepID=UPI001554FEEF|nr:AAA family ATPase [Mesorhizobium sp. NZP2077]QKD19780.1 AAA family ATPase [Mesorhizobium sp. NZP2077]